VAYRPIVPLPVHEGVVMLQRSILRVQRQGEGNRENHKRVDGMERE
jgi:hypothetical protein